MERFKAFLGRVWTVIRDAGLGYSHDHASHLSAAMAFYALFAVAPLLLIVTAVAGLLWGPDVARAELLGQLHTVFGFDADARSYIGRLVENWQNSTTGWLATIVGAATSFYLAFRFFDALRDMINTVWSVRLRADVSWANLFRSYARSVATMLLVVPLFIVSTLVSEVFTRIGPWLEKWIGGTADLDASLYLAVGFVLLTGMFAIIFKWLPDVFIHWRDVWFGAIATALLFSVGRGLISWYMARATTASLFGAAGSAVVLMFWIYYSAQILFFGAEITQVYASNFGRGIEPSPSAAPITYLERDDRDGD